MSTRRPAHAADFILPETPVASVMAAPADARLMAGAVHRVIMMRRYHFDLVDTNSVTDVTGAILDSDDHARRIARELAIKARHGRPDLIGQGYEIRVRSESGDEISRLALDQPSREGADN